MIQSAPCGVWDIYRLQDPTYLCHWAPAACPGFLLVTLLVDELWIFRVGPITFKYWREEHSETTKTPSTAGVHAAGMLILANPFLEFCFLTPTFSYIILFHMFVKAFDTLKIPEYRFWTRDTLKKVICLSISWELFLLLCHSHMNLNIQNSWPRGLSTWQFSTGNNFLVKWSINPRPWGWPQFF